VSHRFLAFDLGAESGRAMLGTVRPDRLVLDEICRFPNEPVPDATGVHWDALRLWLEIRRGLDRVADTPLAGIGVDTWGCDFALLGERGNLLENPYHYRDTRTDGVIDRVCRDVNREALYARTGTQLLALNTLFQLYASRRDAPKLMDAASALLLMPDLFNYWLTGVLRSEYTIASTSQMVDPRSRSWAADLLDDLGLPSRLLQPIVEPGTRLGELRPDVSARLAGTPVIAPASHDTGSAFAAVSHPPTDAIVSSGTWSLLGAEVAGPVMTARARELNFTNEGGVCGTTRLLKNIAGLWLLQSSARVWAASYDELLAAAEARRDGFRALFDPDHRDFFHPPDMPSAIAAFCRRTRQLEPDGPGGFTRAILESLALKYRVVLEALEELTGTRYTRIRIVGGGSRNRLLCQFTADATGREVLAGPAEATALGNVAMQMVAAGVVASLDEARAMIERSFPPERFEPIEPDLWDAQYARFLALCS
jgi:rhamnulokinase